MQVRKFKLSRRISFKTALINQENLERKKSAVDSVDFSSVLVINYVFANLSTLSFFG